MVDYSICETCKKPKANDDRSVMCKKCSISLAKKKQRDLTGRKFITVEHKAGNRSPQIVYKYEDSCPKCNKLFYRFSSSFGITCKKCTTYGDRKINHNGVFVQLYKNTPHQGPVKVRSSYEDFYIDYLTLKKIDFFYEPKIFKLSDGSTYTPDFYLPQTDEYIDLKGYRKPENILKIQAFKSEYPNLNFRLIEKKEIKALGHDQNSYKKSRTISINGDKWEYIILSDKKYNKLLSEGSDGLSDIEYKKIYLRESKLSLELIIHEVTHCYFSQLNSVVASLTDEQVEEIFTEFVARNIFKVLKTSFFIYLNSIKILNKRYGINVSLENIGLDTPDFRKFLTTLSKIVPSLDNNELTYCFKHSKLSIKSIKEGIE